MKTKELIEALQKEDPQGESEVVVRGNPIYFVEKLPGYYDGPYQILIQNNSPYFNIDGVHITRKGEKVRLHTYNWQDLVWDNPDSEIVVDSDVFRAEQLRHRIDKERAESKALKEESNQEFISIVRNKIENGYRPMRLKNEQTWLWLYVKEGEDLADIIDKRNERVHNTGIFDDESYHRQLNGGSVQALLDNPDLFRKIEHFDSEEFVQVR